MRRILVVEDEYDLQQVVADVLRDEGYEVSVCGNGRDALECLRRERPELVVMDVMMPILSGVQALEEIRGSPEWRELPVILMSAAWQERREPPPWQGFLKKPFRLEELLGEVKRVLGE